MSSVTDLRASCVKRNVASKLQRNTALSCATGAPAHEGFRRYLEFCHEQAPPGAEFALGGAIAYVYGTPQPADLINERALIKYVLRFANAEEDPSSRTWFVETQRVPLTPKAEADRAQLSADLATENIEGARSKFRAVLTSIYKNKHQTLGHSAEDLLRSVWPLPVLRRKPNQHLALCWVITSVAAANAFIAMLLLDQERDVGDDLCRCHLEPHGDKPGCSRFFLAEKSTTGLSRRRYCTKEHMNEFHKRRSYARVLKSRARRAKRARKSKCL